MAVNGFVEELLTATIPRTRALFPFSQIPESATLNPAPRHFLAHERRYVFQLILGWTTTAAVCH